MAIDRRKQRILEAIVALYAADGEPVGSGLLANYFDMAVSSATLRNEMAALTRLGLLEQPHTSAGRVPSPQGYRYYLNNLLGAPGAIVLPPEDKARINDLFATMDAEPEKLAQSAARTLADYTGLATAATTPQADDLCIAHFEVVQVGRYTAAVLAVTSAGGVRTRVARVGEGFTRGGAQALAALLNRSLTFVVPEDVTDALTAELLEAAPPRLAPVVRAAEALVRTGPQVCFEGAQYLAGAGPGRAQKPRHAAGAFLRQRDRPRADRTAGQQGHGHTGRGHPPRTAGRVHRQQAVPCGRRAHRRGGACRFQPDGLPPPDPHP